MTWCHVPETDCPSAQAAAASTWASCLPSRDFTPDALSSGRNIQDQPSSQGSAPDTSPRHQSGMTSPHSMPGHLPGHSTPCLQDTHASRSAMLDGAAGQTTSGTSGPMLPGSRANLAPASNGYSSKTSPVTSPSALKPCCENFGTWASRLRLASSQRLKLARRMNVSGFSSWPTATPMQTRDGWSKDDLDAARQTAKEKARNGNGFGLGLGAAATSWPTPQSRDTRMGDSQESARRQRKEDQGWSQNLNDTAETWPTPSAMQDTKGDADLGAIQRREELGKQIALAHRARAFTRPAPPTWDDGVKLSQLRPIWRPLRASLIASYGRATWRRLWKARNKRRLNPLFVEWLMGWPSGHALCACSATEFALWQRQMRGALSRLPMASGPWIWKPTAPTAALHQLSLFEVQE